MYWEVGKVYGQTSRDMRRLGEPSVCVVRIQLTRVLKDSVTRSPLYTIYGESIAGVTVLRAFGAGSKFLREMHQHVDTNTNPYYWMWGGTPYEPTSLPVLSRLFSESLVVSTFQPDLGNGCRRDGGYCDSEEGY